MNATMSRNIIRFVAAPVAAAGIIGGAALGFSAVANASTVRRPARIRVVRRSARRLATCRSILSRVTRRWTPLSSSIHSSGMAMRRSAVSSPREPLTVNVEHALRAGTILRSRPE